MVIFKCKMCGGNLEVSEGSSVTTCEYCGTEQTLPTSNDEGIVNLFNRANYLRLKCEFDKASETYEKILDLDNTQAEAHWGIVLCKYGIEYVDAGVDEDLFNSKKPTCHRTQLESILTDADYLEVLQNSDAVSQPIYKAEAKRINEIQKKILEVVKNENPFDVFICYKERDENNQKTRDSVIANEIYHELTEVGLKVFYAAITLEDKLGEEYEPYIYAALSSAKVMLVLGTRVEYINAVWVKNEWSRYLHMMKTDKSRKRTLIPCYRDMDAYDLPDEFSHLQALDMSGIAFMPDLIRNIRKLIGNVQQSGMNSQQNTSSSAENKALPLLKRAFIFLEDREFQRADEMLEKVLNSDPENARAYIGKIMVMNNVCSENRLSECTVFETGKESCLLLRDVPFFEKASRFADDEYKHVLEEYNICNLEMWYNNAIKLRDDGYLDEAKTAFEAISGYKDSDKLYEECSTLKNERIYNSAKIKMDAGMYVEAKEIFETISEYKDASEMANKCKHLEMDRRYDDAVHDKMCGSYPEAANKFNQLGNYRDSISQKNECIELENERIYNLALNYYNKEKNYAAAILEFSKIRGYRNADKNIEICNERIEYEERRAKRKASATKAGKKASKGLIIVGIIIAVIVGIVLLFSRVIIPFIADNILVFVGIIAFIVFIAIVIAKARE